MAAAPVDTNVRREILLATSGVISFAPQLLNNCVGADFSQSLPVRYPETTRPCNTPPHMTMIVNAVKTAKLIHANPRTSLLG
jgi:hypothetical protein